MKLITWNPITRPVSIFNDLDSIFNDFGNLGSITDQRTSWRPRFEVLNTETTYCIRAELPGMSKKDINIELENNVLTLSGERKWNETDDNNYSEFCWLTHRTHGVRRGGGHTSATSTTRED